MKTVQSLNFYEFYGLPVPFGNRKDAIISKLKYANELLAILAKDLLKSYRPNSRAPRFIEHRVAEILSSTRECFDMMGNDLFESYVDMRPSSFYQKNKGKIKLKYFPYYETQLVGERNGFSYLSYSCPLLLKDIRDFCQAINGSYCFPGTSLDMGIIQSVRGMVNHKKHNTVFEFKKEKDSILVSGKNGSFIFDKDFKNNHPNITLVIPNPQKAVLVSSFRFVSNNAEIWDFSRRAISVSELVLDWFYYKYFSNREKIFVPQPPPIIEQRPATEAEENLFRDGNPYEIKI